MPNSVYKKYDDQYNRLNKSEKEYLKNNPLHAFAIRESEKTAFAETTRIFGRNGRNDRSDAFRHCFWSAILARDIGYKNALEFTTAHEEDPKNPEAEKSMDLANNAVGLEIGRCVGPRGDNQHLSFLCHSALMNNRLAVLSNNEPTK